MLAEEVVINPQAKVMVVARISNGALWTCLMLLDVSMLHGPKAEAEELLNLCPRVNGGQPQEPVGENDSRTRNQ